MICPECGNTYYGTPVCPKHGEEKEHLDKRWAEIKENLTPVTSLKEVKTSLASFEEYARGADIYAHELCGIVADLVSVVETQLPIPAPKTELRRAYLVAHHATHLDRVSFGVFSEERPTCRLSDIQSTVLVGKGETFEKALEDLARRLDAMPWAEFVHSRMVGKIGPR